MPKHPNNPVTIITSETPSNLLVTEFSYDMGSISQEFKDFIRDNIIVQIQTLLEVAVPLKVHQTVFYKE